MAKKNKALDFESMGKHAGAFDDALEDKKEEKVSTNDDLPLETKKEEKKASENTEKDKPNTPNANEESKNSSKPTETKKQKPKEKKASGTSLEELLIALEFPAKFMEGKQTPAKASMLVSSNLKDLLKNTSSDLKINLNVLTESALFFFLNHFKDEIKATIKAKGKKTLTIDEL